MTPAGAGGSTASPVVVSPVVLVVDAGSVADDQFVVGLTAEGFRALLARSGERGLALFGASHPDVVLVGDTPDLSGLEIVRLLCDTGRAPVIAMSSTGDEDEVVLALQEGAADFLNHPRRVRECAVRIWLALRGSRVPVGSRVQPVPASSVVAAGPVEVDLRRREVRVRGQRVAARPKEIDLLGLLVAEAGCVVSRKRAIEAIWSDARGDRSKTLDVHIRRLRFHVETEPSRPRHLITVRGYGHRFDP